MRNVMAGSGGIPGTNTNCSLTGNEKILYSGDEPVAYFCEWKCD
jgi:hypothetical protein